MIKATKKNYAVDALLLFICVVSAVCIGISLGKKNTYRAAPISIAQLSRVASNPKVALINIIEPYDGEVPHTDLYAAPNQLSRDNPSLPRNMNIPIILYDTDGSGGRKAAQTLNSLGYSNVRYVQGGIEAWKKSGAKTLDLVALEKEVVPEDGVELPVSWGDLGKQLTDIGVINLPEFKKAVPLTPEQEHILTRGSPAKITMNAQNSQFVVDVLWALGLAQKSIVYDRGPMGTEYKKDVGNFASTGGWSLSREPAMTYLNKYDLIPLSPQQQEIVADIAHNVYRPCCNNSTWFPDCNHGMAALAIIELLVANHVDEKTIYQKLLGFNSIWFPQNYMITAAHFARSGVAWRDVDAKTVLGFDYSSAVGASNIAKTVGPLPFATSFGGSCGT